MTVLANASGLRWVIDGEDVETSLMQGVRQGRSIVSCQWFCVVGDGRPVAFRAAFFCAHAA
jgi:hypothetical protein